MLKLHLRTIHEVNGVHFNEPSRKATVHVDTNKKDVDLSRSGPFVRVTIIDSGEEKHIKCERVEVSIDPNKDE